LDGEFILQKNMLKINGSGEAVHDFQKVENESANPRSSARMKND